MEVIKNIKNISKNNFQEFYGKRWNEIKHASYYKNVQGK